MHNHQPKEILKTKGGERERDFYLSTANHQSKGICRDNFTANNEFKAQSIRSTVITRDRSKQILSRKKIESSHEVFV